MSVGVERASLFDRHHKERVLKDDLTRVVKCFHRIRPCKHLI
jgi:hypothetical protein